MPRQRVRPALPVELVHVVGVGDGADGCHALGAHAARLAGVEAHDRPARVAADELAVGAGRARDLAAAAGLELDVVHDGADRQGGELHGVAGLHVGLDAGDDHVAHAQALRRQDVGLRVVLVLDERDEGGAVGIVLQPLDLARDVVLGAAEIDLAVDLLVAAADVARGDAAEVVAAARLGLALGQHLDRRALPQVAAIHQHQLTQARRGRTEGSQCHRRLLTGPSSRRWNGPLRGSPPRA